MSANPFDHPLLSQLLGDEELAGYLSVECELAAMLRFEQALARSSAALGLIPQEAARDIRSALGAFEPDIAALASAVLSDGVVVPNLIAQMRDLLPDEVKSYLHFGATSQDVVDTGLMIRLSEVLKIVHRRLAALVQTLNGLEGSFGSRRMMGHTRMQAALPIQVADRLISWKVPLLRYQDEVAALLHQRLPIQFGGAVGTLERFGGQGPALRAALAEELELLDCAQWHSQRGIIADLSHLFAKISGSLGKIGQDIALMAQVGTEITLSGGGASSAMPHKQNPVAAEVLVAQARFTATLIAGSHQSLVHEQERSGSAWTLEWMVVPQIVQSCGASLLMTQRLLASITLMGS